MTIEEDSKLDKLVSELATQRDELRVQLHLFKAETKDEWHDVEEKWHHLNVKIGRASQSAKKSAGEIGAAADQLAEEIGSAYKRMKRALK